MDKNLSIGSELIAQTYEKLFGVYREIGMHDDEIQKQITVYGRAPFSIHDYSWSVNERGVVERFLNNKHQGVVRLPLPYCEGFIKGYVERMLEKGIILFSDNMELKIFSGEFLDDFKPKPKGTYEITEAFQVLSGDFTASWESSNRLFFRDGHKWNFPKIFRDNQFLLHEYTNPLNFSRFAKRADELEKLVQEHSLKTVKETYELIENDERLSELTWLIDCGLMRHNDILMEDKSILPAGSVYN